MKLYIKILLSTLIIISSYGIYAETGIKGTVKIKKKGKAKKAKSNVVIFLENLKESNKSGIAILKQKGKKFSPRVVPIVAGGKVKFPNLDAYNHNVFSPTNNVLLVPSWISESVIALFRKNAPPRSTLLPFV